VHEYSIAADIVQIANQKSDNKKITGISLSIGTISGIYHESLKMYIEHIFYEKYESKIDIKIDLTDAEFECSCGKKYFTDNMLNPCPFCGKFNRTIIKGNECIIKSIKTE
jgi:hydrogenase nickel insertion protein HypA